MKRFILIAMLCVLPYQFAWAAVSIYCDYDEQGETDAHFGHHSHHADGDKAKAPMSKAGLGLGCDHCHHGSTLALYFAVMVKLSPPPTPFILISTARPPDPAVAEPERPNWPIPRLNGGTGEDL